jgi:hypothetical protein
LAILEGASDVPIRVERATRKPTGRGPEDCIDPLPAAHFETGRLPVDVLLARFDFMSHVNVSTVLH